MPEQCSPYSGKVLVKFNGLHYIGICRECKKYSVRLSFLALSSSKIRGLNLLALSVGGQLMQPLCLSVTAVLMTYPPLPRLVPALQQPVAGIYHELAYMKQHLPPTNTTRVLQSFVSLAVSGFIPHIHGYLIPIDLMCTPCFIFLLFHVRTFGSMSRKPSCKVR